MCSLNAGRREAERPPGESPELNSVFSVSLKNNNNLPFRAVFADSPSVGVRYGGLFLFSFRLTMGY